VGENQTHGERTKIAILDTGMALWRDDPRSVTARGIGNLLGLTHSAVLYHFGSSADLRDAVALEAVRTGCGTIVPQLIAARHPAVAQMGDVERRGYMLGAGQ
jgi:AcrR family transcriptional regulator